MDISRLQQLLAREEGPKLDFKAKPMLKTESEKKEFAKLVCAIANSRGGRGYILYGVEDKTKKILGIDAADFQEEKFQQVISSRCSPPIAIKLDIVDYLFKQLAVVTIYRSDQRPHQLRDTGSFFIRRGSTTDTAQRAEIATMLQESGLVTLETTPVFRGSMDNLNFEQLFQLMPWLKSLPENALILNLTSQGFICKDPDTNKLHPTVGGALLFGFDVNSMMPHAMVKLVISKNHQIYYLTGTIFEILDQFQQNMEHHLKGTTFPLTAVNEALANALVHRDYWQLHRYIVVEVKPNHISITNPGSLIDANSLSTGDRDLNHPLRNPWLFQNLLVLDPKKRFFRSGLGLKRIQQEISSDIKVTFSDRPDKNLFQVFFTKLNK
ncbi:MAG: putative DNA binding domain-containing protein [Bacillota bacterium]|nr:putative DNA binding domain-containing protein [Bacillota bacterium]